MKKIALAVSAVVFLLPLPANSQTPIKEFRSVSFTHEFNDKLLLDANDGMHGDELWISDGTTEGTKLLKDIFTGWPSASVSRPFNYKNKAWFAARSEKYENELWFTDGTSEGTVLFADLTPQGDYYGGTTPQSFTIFNDYLYFTSAGGKLYRTNGEPGNVEVVDERSYGRITNLSIAGNVLYYYKTGDLLHWTNGSTTGDIDLPLDIENTYFRGLYTAGGRLYALRTSSSDIHVKLYVLNNATLTWTKIFDVKAPTYGSHQIDNFIAVGQKLFFNLRRYYDNVQPTDELWVTPGTASETVMVQSFAWDRHWSGSSMQNFKEFNNQLYFRSGAATQMSLWKSDGTAAGTMKVSDAVMSHPQYTPNPPVVCNDRLFFAGRTTDYQDIGGLWSTDGTGAGTNPELSLAKNGGSTIPYHLASVNGLVFFVDSPGPWRVTLWNTSPAAEINVFTADGQHVNPDGSTQFYIDDESCSTKTFHITNDGKKALALGSIQVTGVDFALKGNLPAVLSPGDTASFDVLFYSATGTGSSGLLSVLSGDLNESPYNVHLITNVFQQKVAFCNAFDNTFSKIIHAVPAAQPVKLSNHSVPELQPSGTSVGTLSVDGNNVVSFSLVPGDGDTNNSYFMIDGSSLRTTRSFTFGSVNHYTIRVRATMADATVVESAFRIAVENVLSPLTLDACEKVPQRLDYQLNAVAVNSDGYVFTVTSNGNIQKSTDGGVTWVETTTNTNIPLSKIFFSGTTGYVLGDNLALKSEDNGSTWFPINLPPSGFSYGKALHFIDAERGYLSGGDGSVYFTDDGAKNWTMRKAGVPFGDHYSDMHFLSEEHGFAVSPDAVYETIDGGRKWTGIDLSEFGYYNRFVSIVFLDDNEGIIATTSGVIRTADGGKTWSKNDLYANDLRHLIFVDSQSGYLYGPGVIYKTSDKGETWMHASNTFALTGIASTQGKLYASHGGQYAFNGTGRAFKVSTDEGSTWQTLQDISYGNHRAISFPTDKKGFILSEHGGYKTGDGGITWKPTKWTDHMLSMHFESEDAGWFADSKNFYETTDGGETFTRVFTLPEDEYKYFGELYVYSSDLMFSLDWSSVLRGTDGGTKWEATNLTQNAVNDMQFLSSTLGYLVSLFGEVHKTTDGGMTWTQVFFPDNEENEVISSIYFVNEQVGYRAGENFSKTVDGGQTWVNIFRFFNSEIRDLWFESELHGYAVSKGVYLYETKDGGVTWKEHYIYDAQEPSGIECRNGNIYLVGGNGYIAQYKNTPAPPLRPAYITGPDVICSGDVQVYTMPVIYGLSYHWQSGLPVRDNSAAVEVEFSSPGQHIISVTAVNTCGVSEARTLVVTSKTIDTPTITGENQVVVNSSSTYAIENSLSTANYAWALSPETSFESTDSHDEISVKWQKGPEFTLNAIVLDAESGCRARSDDFNVQVLLPTSEEEPSDVSISVYPNPTSDALMISSRSTAIHHVKVYDSNGKLMMEKPLATSSSNILSMSGLRAGIYILKIYDSNSAITSRKILKQ